MKKMLLRLWKDEGGFIVTVELILIATILVIGLIAGLTTLRDAVVAELGDTAQAFGAINQSWSASGIDDGQNSGSGAMSFVDNADGFDTTDSSGGSLQGASTVLEVVAPVTPAVSNTGEAGGANQ